MDEKLIIGTRGSKLALWQAHFTQDILKEKGIDSELKIIKTRGDLIQNIGFSKMEGKGFFTKEIEDALLRGDIHLAVHSMKDLPTTSPEGLCITAVSYRANPSDILVIKKDKVTQGKLLKLPEAAVVGTSSARRKAQILGFRPDLQIKDIRGNVPTRLRKLEEGQFDAILLAAAGIERLELDMSGFETIILNPKEFIPAPAQGVLAYQTLTSDTRVRRLLKQIHNPDISAKTNVERGVLKALDGGCQMPLGVYCEQDNMGYFHAIAAKADAWNAPVRQAKASGPSAKELVKEILKQLEG